MEEDDIEEYHDAKERVDVPDKQVEPYVLWDNVLYDDIDDDITKNDVDDDMVINPFNIDSKLDDTNVELDEEEDQLYWNVWGMWLYHF